MESCSQVGISQPKATNGRGCQHSNCTGVWLRHCVFMSKCKQAMLIETWPWHTPDLLCSAFAFLRQLLHPVLGVQEVAKYNSWGFFLSSVERHPPAQGFKAGPLISGRSSYLFVCGLLWIITVPSLLYRGMISMCLSGWLGRKHIPSPW